MTSNKAGRAAIRSTTAREAAASALTAISTKAASLSRDLARAEKLFEEAMARTDRLPAKPPAFDSAEEDALAVAALDRAVADYDATEEPVPFAVVKRIANGESPLKVWREHRGLTQAQLAETTGIKQGSLSDLERGRRSARFETFCKLADALGIALDDLRPPAD